MAANPTPVNDGELIAHCQDLVNGCVGLEASVGLKQNTAASMQAALDAARAALREVGERKKQLGDAREAFRQADAEGERVIGRCRLRLAALFGHSYSAEWSAAGFPGRSTMVPEVFAKRWALLQSLTAYFALKPEHESADMLATTASCAAAYTALGSARHAVNEAIAELAAAVKAKGPALKALRKSMRGLIRELWALLPANDSRWLGFGLNIPGRESMPKPVRSLQLIALGHGRAHAQWSAAPRATRYRVQWRKAGTAEFAAGPTVHDAEAVLQDLPVGEWIEVRVLAANAVDECGPSPVASALIT